MLYFIVNLKSRTGESRAIWETVKQELKLRNERYMAFRTKGPGHAMQLAKKISSFPEEEIRLVVCGGDGTINEVINGITDFEKVSLGIIPMGSGNDFAKGLGITGTPDELIKRILNDNERRLIDLGSVRYSENKPPRLFGISAGVGLDAIVCKKAMHSKQKAMLNKIGMGKLVYLLLTVETLFSMRTVRGIVGFDGEKSKRFDKLIFSASMNLPAEGGGVPMVPWANPQDGRLGMCLAHDIPRWKAFLDLPWLVVGKHDRVKNFYIRDYGSCVIRLAKPVTLHADGEYLGEVSELHFEVEKGKLQLLQE